MSKQMDTIYNENIAEEKLKQGTKYEKLAAVVFKILNQNDVVIHDLTLRGDGKKTGHQIDVTVQSPGSNVSKRILIECKDYDSKVGISIVRDFFGAVHQINPNEAFVVTTEGYTKGARTFAEDEGIKLAILRGFKEEDWEGRLRAIHITGKFIFMNQPRLSWVAANEQEIEKFHANANEESNTTQNTSTRETFFYDQAGNPQENLQTVLEPIFNSLPRDPDSPTTGRYEFGTIKYVELAGVLVGVRGFDYEFTSNQIVTETIVDQGSKVALLVFKVLDGEFDKIIFDQDLDKWTFNDNGEVISK
ncbi:restriction endonuclease [Bacillus cereus]|uniref:restriction endonuclease n=1 Tax=Bacillus cereus TaxID=1396 RepID=UPI002AC00B7B|nr:restriction endonuclease [Bacillus cereus]MDA1785047.1 restriction endonuclease [Bacillus cereus]MDZ4537051.1 restriction endonuclease [Bacillus cereus]